MKKNTILTASLVVSSSRIYILLYRRNIKSSSKRMMYSSSSGGGTFVVQKGKGVSHDTRVCEYCDVMLPTPKKCGLFINRGLCFPLTPAIAAYSISRFLFCVSLFSLSLSLFLSFPSLK